MFIDYVTLMLINMAAGLAILGCYLWQDAARENLCQRWAPALAVPGAVAAICGFAMSFTWPLPRPYNIPFGEMSVLLGVLLLGAAWGLARRWDLTPLGLYAVFAGGIAVLVGIRMIDLKLTQNPLLSGVGFILTGLCGVFAIVVLRYPQIVWLRRLGSIALVIAAAIWTWTACLGYWFHLKPPA